MANLLWFCCVTSGRKWQSNDCMGTMVGMVKHGKITSIFASLKSGQQNEAVPSPFIRLYVAEVSGFSVLFALRAVRRILRS